MNLPNSLHERTCLVCGSQYKHVLFHQKFSAMSSGSLLNSYDVVACQHCGLCFADGIPEQDVFDRYYTEMSKYEYTDHAGVQSDTDLQRFQEVVDLVAPHVHPTNRLLDIGCATGGLLAEFKRRGFSNLCGVDPSPACAEITRRLHTIPATALSISGLDQMNNCFDLLLLTGVLEHLRDVESSMKKIRGCLQPGGLIYIEVPDASHYDRHFSAPFQFFSMEHINFCSPVSLRNLLAKYGFSCVFTQRVTRYLSPKAIEPAVAGLFRWDLPENLIFEPQRDVETEPALQRYIQQSTALELRIHSKIDALANAGHPLAVWGVGTHTLRLLKTSRLLQAHITAFIDSNIHYQGKTLEGIPVVSPDKFCDANAEVLISSQTAEEEIFQLITQKLHWPHVIHRLYAD
jgi:2-polyprenyl-3-methyl-5-hydroxy-6-metoxy-1,4-benzoquinol methylase